MMGPRDRRGKDKVDVESLEQENDKGLDMLAERVALLKAASGKINTEAEQQLSILDRMEGAFVQTRGFLSSVNDKFRGVMADKNNARLTYGVSAVAVGLFLLWWFTMR